ncbi:MAG: hypothetical protein LBI10_08350, partial [Deltaproteobacteria bacterium]|nr:hypothetical protein [Deltaproteobacteria bacterium]
ISPEIWCYIGVAALGIYKLLINKIFILSVWILLIVNSFFIDLNFYTDIKSINKFIYEINNLIISFLSGNLLYQFRHKISINILYLIISIICMVLFYFLKIYIFIFAIFGTYLIIYIAFTKYIKLYNFSKYGDFSYGMFIYGYFIQQLAFSLSITYDITMNYLLNLIFSYPIILLFAILSWHIVEKRFLNITSKHV